jgi:hypothetical protein
MANQRRAEPRFQLGDHVRLTLGADEVPGTVIEVRGTHGREGHRMYTVEVSDEPRDPIILSMPEVELKPGEPPSARKHLLTKEKILKHLKHGGLMGMLRHDSFLGRDQPRVWLCLDAADNVTYTFRPYQGLIGGVTIPYEARPRFRRGIFEDKKEEVISFLASFGLTRDEAEGVIRRYGIIRRRLGKNRAARSNSRHQE